MRALAGFASGVLFGLGLALGGMTQPAKVLAFLDVAGAWDGSLMLFMATALVLYAAAYRLSLRWKRPLLGTQFPAAPGTRIDARLLGGAVLFGIGWGIAGFCPGPAVVSAGTGAVPSVVFVVCMLAGMLLLRGFDRLAAQRTARAEPGVSQPKAAA